jgi:allantoate deiminase
VRLRNEIADNEKMIEHCRTLAQFTEEPGYTTRTFLSPPMRPVHAYLREWMDRAGMVTHIDAVGNLRGRWGGEGSPLWIGSHLDTVPRAGAFDGILGVVMAIALVERVKPPYPIEVIAFSEEEGVRFGIPFIGSRAIVGDALPLLEKRDPKGITVAEAIRNYGLDPSRLAEAEVCGPSRGYLEFHIEQGPVLDNLNLPVAVVDAIVGLSRLWFTFEGHANHAGTTPMLQRQDALTAAAEWILAVEREAQTTEGLVATVGRIEAEPGAANAIPGLVRASLDLRHASDTTRKHSLARVIEIAGEICKRRGIDVSYRELLDQPACPMDENLIRNLDSAVLMTGNRCHHMASGAGHDAMIMAQRMPSVMLFLRSPGGLSHHPDESVVADDIDLAMQVAEKFIQLME